MIGVLRETPRIWVAQRTEATRLSELLAGDLPVLAVQATPRFIVPAPVSITKIVWRDASRGTPAMAQRDILASGGAFASKKYRANSAVAQVRLQPVFPLQVGQAALRIAAGAIDGTTVAVDGQPMVIKGTTKRVVVERVERFRDGDKDVVEIHRLERSSPLVTAINEATGEITAFEGDAGLATLMGSAGTAQALLDAVEAAAPPRYAMQLDPAVAACLDTLISVSGRHLPGYAPGLLAMQKHAAAAMLTMLTTPDPGWGGAIPNGGVLAAEMGCGKSGMGAAVVELLRLFGDR